MIQEAVNVITAIKNSYTLAKTADGCVPHVGVCQIAFKAVGREGEAWGKSSVSASTVARGWRSKQKHSTCTAFEGLKTKALAK